MSRIINGCDVPLNRIGGTVPDVSGAMQNYFQQMVFTLLQKVVSGFQVVENAAPIVFQGVIQPFSSRQLLMKPEGQRAWSWYTVHAEPGIILKVDDIVDYLGQPYRVMGKTNYKLYGYVEYQLQTDWFGEGVYP